jgi:hypothetical protein
VLSKMTQSSAMRIPASSDRVVVTELAPPGERVQDTGLFHSSFYTTIV